MTPDEVDRVLRQVLLKDLRVQCRTRGLSPAGGKEQLSERLREHMLSSSDFTLKNELGHDLVIEATAGTTSVDIAKGHAQNQYMRPAGQQNVGNFLTDRASSRVLAPPGGKTSISFGPADDAAPGSPDGKPAASPRPGRDSPLPAAALAGLPAGLPGELPAALGPADVGAAGVNVAKAKTAGLTPGGASQIIFG